MGAVRPTGLEAERGRMHRVGRDSRVPAAHPATGGAAASPGDLSDCLRSVEATADGLSSAEAERRLRRVGPNVLTTATGTLPLAVLANQFRSPLVIILLAAAGLSFALGEVDEALIIAAIVLASAGLGFHQEYRAASTVQALGHRLAVRVRVLRDGVLSEIGTSNLVPGDVIMLAGGSLIPADAVLLDAQELHVEEAALTGESFPVVKAAAVPSLPLIDDNMVHMGTSVRSGAGRALVLHTGGATQYGAIASAVARLEPETSFAKGVRRFGNMMTQIMMVIVVLVLAANVLLGRPLLDSLLFAAALAVGITPELLPAVVTVTLARGARQLAAAGVLVKRLVAIENLGAMDVLCTDKTGTLTEGEVRLEDAVDTAGNRSANTVELAFLNASMQTGLPNPLDSAIIAGATVDAAGYRKLGEVPYDFERKRLSVLLEGPAGTILICKGAVAAVLAACDRIAVEGQSLDLTPARRDEQEQRLANWSAEGLRVLAIATRPLPGRTDCHIADESGLTLVGYLLFSDPPKAGIAETVAAIGGRGIALKILTGDNRYVAVHVAAAIGMVAPTLMTGADLAKLSDRLLARRVLQVDIFAEVTPDQKERIINALRRAHRVVGYLGDGVNDAPALRAADLGISVDTAVDAAKAAADIVLLKRDLDVLLDGVVIGRAAFGNTIKYIAITTSANLGNMISMAAASLFLPFLPLLAKQILINNFLSDLPLMTISTDRVDAEVLERPGRWDFPHLLRIMLGFGLVSSLFDALTFVVLLLVFHADATQFQTGWFLQSLLTELAIVGVMRSQKPIFSSAISPLLLWTSVAVGLAALALPYLPITEATGFQPLPPKVLLTLLAIVIAYVLASELLKARIGAFEAPRTSRRGRHGSR
jgi:Mg2+-importing ATPase